MDWLKENNIVKYGYGDNFIFYSPIGRCYVVATQYQYDCFRSTGKFHEIFCHLTDYIPIALQPKVRAPKDYTLLTVLPNNMCNFSCYYCYSAKGRNSSQLELKNLKIAIDYFFSNKENIPQKTLTISFMGGGEPMLSWNCIKSGIIYARKIAKEKNRRLNIRIITNGSILENEHLHFFKDNDIEISVSFEILPEIQNLQRKHYELVSSNIRRLLDYGIPVQINSTITNENVERMEEMIERTITDYPTVKNLMFEPVVSQELFDSPQDMRLFYEKYAEGFIKCRILADTYNVSVTSFAYLRTIFPLERACPGEFCLTAGGNITGCYCIDSEKLPLFLKTKYGSIENNTIVFDEQAFNNLINDNIYRKTECADCEVRWNCGGGCFLQYNTYDKLYCEEVCLFTRNFVRDVVYYKINRMWKNKYDSEIKKQPIFFKEEL